jgi:MBG domain (YGX type)/Galactose oxidase, central domain
MQKINSSRLFSACFQYPMLSLGILALFAPLVRAADALNYTKNYYVTGDVVTGGVGSMRGTGVNGFATRTFDFSGVPAGADIVAAFLYWETVETTTVPSAVNGFLGVGPTGSVPIASNAIVGAVRGNSMNTACWSSGGTGGASSASGRVYRADVLRYLPVDHANNVRLANGSYTVKLPDGGGSGNGNIVYVDGASLVVVYRVLTPGTPLRAVVIYDGAYTMTKFSPGMTQTIGGIYDALGGAAKMTQIVANGQAGNSETLTVNGAGIVGGNNPFTGTAGTRWDNSTFNFNLDPHAASYSTQVTSSDNQLCLTWLAIVTSTPVTDSDGDGLLDSWETSGLHLNPGDLTHPATFGGCPEYPMACVNLPAMQANPAKKDIFVEIDWLKVTGGHEHKPKLDALNAIGATFNGHGISVHFDVGNNYQLSGSPGSSVSPYIIPYAALPKGGGETIEESTFSCPPASAPATVCSYSEPYAVLGWKKGFRAVKDGFPALSMPAHFARNRKDIFHYVLFAHALAGPFDAAGHPLTADPSSVSGVADRPGGDLMITLGLWRSDLPENDQVGSALVQAGTLMHELGHNLGLSHAGLSRTPNCVPIYPSVMNYLYQTRGLTGTMDGASHIDYSSGTLTTPLDETNLSETILSLLPYRIRYYGPVVGSDPPDSAAVLHCDGTPVTSGVPMIRLENTSPFIDWDHNGASTPGSLALDVNYDGQTGTFSDFDDWGHLNLQQISARLNVSSLSVDVHLGQTDLGQTDLGQTDLGQTDLGQTDLGQTDLGQTDLGQTDLGQTDLGQTDLGQTDLGQTDLGDEDYITHVLSTVDAPPGLTAESKISSITLTAPAPATGQIKSYNFYRSDPLHPIPAFFRNVAGGQPEVTTDDVVDSSTTLYNTNYSYYVTSLVQVGSNINQSSPSSTASGIVKHLFIKANDKVRMYGVANPSFDFTTTGLDPGLTGTTTCTTTADQTSPGGTYPITCSGLTPEAGVTYTSGILTITKANQAPVTMTGPTDVIYGVPGTATAIGGSGTGAFSFSAGVSTGCTVVGTTVTVTNASGTCVLTSTRAGDATYYDSAPSAPFTVTMHKATPTVTILGGRFIHDGNPHPATGTVTGVGGILLGTPAFTYTPGGSTVPVDVGSYLVTGFFAGNNNYTAASTGSATIKIDGFVATGSMGTARSYHTSTLLGNGKVLVAGGLSSSGAPLADGELYDPGSGTFAPTANNMPNKAVGHTATLLPNGKVLVTGGGNASSQLYDPATNAWSGAGGMSSQRTYHTATLLPNGRVLIAGGSTNNGTTVNSAQLYDPVSGSFSGTGSMTVSRDFHTATLLTSGPNAGKVLITGGRTSQKKGYAYLSTAELYNPATGVFTAAGSSMTAARYGHTAAVITSGANSGKVLIAGGANTAALSTAELYDPATGAFSATSALTSARQYVTATVISTGVLAAGGLNSTGPLASAEQYQNSGFVASDTMKAARAAHTATLLNNGSVLIVGGQNSSGVSISTAELFRVNP